MDIIKNREFLVRRLHSLLGIVPMGVFLFEHFFINSYALKGPAAFNEKVEFLRSLPYLDLIEAGGIFFPFFLHIAIGIYIMFQGKPNPIRYKYSRNYMYVLQRYTALIAFGFIFFHVISLRFFHNPEEVDFYSLLGILFANPAMASFYLIGSAAVIFHFCNGFCTCCMTWGVTITPQSQKVTAYVMTLAGFSMFAVVLNAMFAFVSWSKMGYYIFG